MDSLFELDSNDYDESLPINESVTVRAVIVVNHLIAVQQADNGMCKLIGGGVEENEDHIDTLTREVEEEAGLLLDTNSVILIGNSIEKHLDIFDKNSIFLRKTYYYGCRVFDAELETNLTESEQAAGFTLTFMSIDDIIEANKDFMDKSWIERDTRFLTIIKENPDLLFG